MDKVQAVKEYINKTISESVAEDNKWKAYSHSYGVASVCSMLAGKRGLNTEIAYISGLLHDIYAYQVDSYCCHAASGAEMIRVVLKNLKLFTLQEQTLICSAVFHHDDLDITHGVYEELLKDADILYPFLEGGTLKYPMHSKKRLDNLTFDLRILPTSIQKDASRMIQSNYDAQPEDTFSRSAMADYAYELVNKKIEGNRTDKEFMNIIKYFTENNAYDELCSHWCAAFIYHCCREEHLSIPIRIPNISSRFSEVAAWIEWSRHEGFYYDARDDFKPEKGDLVVYNRNISGSINTKLSWYDRIGIVYECKYDELTVAEGKSENSNISGLIKRKIDSTIGGYIRINEKYRYNNGKFNYISCFQ